MKNTTSIFNIILSCLLIGGCSLFNGSDDKPERTYPKAMDYEFSSVQEIKNKLVPPDSVNVDIYVIGVNKCPENAYCFGPDGIVIADSLGVKFDDFEKKIHFYVESPHQFKKDRRYRLSLDVGTYPGNGEKHIQLLGYTPASKR